MSCLEVKTRKIWDVAQVPDRDKVRFEFPYLIFFKGWFYCGFREADIHHQHPSARCRLIRSKDGANWQTAHVFSWLGADLREIRLSVTPEGMLLVNTLLTYLLPEPSSDAEEYPFDRFDRPNPDRKPHRSHAILEIDKTSSMAEVNACSQSVTWLSADGENWSAANCSSDGTNTFRWEIQWYNGIGYSVGYNGKDKEGTLYRTRDGRSFRPLLENCFFPERGACEFAMSFAPDGTMYGLLRNARKVNSNEQIVDKDGHEVDQHDRKFRYGGKVPMFGIGTAPFYTKWEWKDIHFDWHGDGKLTTAEEQLRAPFGGPQLLRISDGRLLATGRVLSEEYEDGRITIFTVDPKTAIFTRFAVLDGATYGSMLEHNGKLYVVCGREDEDVPNQLAISMAELPLII